MNYKDLAEEYSIKEYARVNGAKDSVFIDNRCFTFDDIKAAFNAGRESVVETMPKLLFKETQSGLAAVDDMFGFIIYYVYKSASVDGPRFTLATDYEMPIQRYDTLEEAKDAANECYKKRIKQALGL